MLRSKRKKPPVGEQDLTINSNHLLAQLAARLETAYEVAEELMSVQKIKDSQKVEIK